MLIPITQEKFDELIPLIASAEQYQYYWGKTEDFLRRALISFILVVAIFIVGSILGKGAEPIRLISQIIGGLYWFWSPIYCASVQNAKYRRLPYCCFWRGKITDVYLTEEIVRTQEEVDQLGRLLKVENRERRINIEVGDKEGYLAKLQAPIDPRHRALKPGQAVELLVLSSTRNLDRKIEVTDAYIPRLDLWLGLYPYVRRDVFWDVREQLRYRYGKKKNNPPPRPRPGSRKRRPTRYDRY